MTETQSKQHTLDDLPTRKVLEGLSRLHEWVILCDPEGRVAWMSEDLGRTVGGAERYIGATCRELFPHLPHSVYSASLRDRLRRGESLRDVRLELEHRGGRALSVDLSAFPVANGRDDEPLIVLIVRPVEERIRSGSKHRRLLRSYRDILEKAPDGVIAFDRSSFITYANPMAESLLGERSGGAVGKPIAMYLPQVTGFGSVATELRPHHELTRREFEIRRSDGGRMWVSISTRTLRDEGGRVECSVAYLRDVTERLRMLDRLERKNAELESYVHTVSHDLRSPLVALLGFGRLLRQDYAHSLGEVGNHFLDRIEQAGRTMEALIHDLLELSQIGSPGEQRALVDPRAVLQQLHAEFKPRLDEQSVTLELPANPPLVLCDRTRLYQVFSNLVGNAVRHMGEGENSTIVVEVDEQPGCHHIRVRDNGRGIPSDDHERIFEIFQTLGPRSPAERSTGIGLAIVKKIAESHGGRAWVESEIDRGSTFHVTLARS